MSRLPLHQQPDRLTPRAPYPASAPASVPGSGPGWPGHGDDRRPAWAPASGPPQPDWQPATGRPQPDRAAPGYGGRTWYIDDGQHTAASVEPLPVELAASVQLRRAALDRMMRMNLLHARHAWEQRRHDPLAPHAVAMLFAGPDQWPVYAGGGRLSAAWRLWVDGDDARDLADRLYRYHKALAEQLSPAEVLDLRALATGHDPQLHPDAVYVGLGVSSLDTATGSWRQLLHDGSLPTLQTPAAIRRHVPEVVPVASDTDVPGTVRILLADGAVIVAQRRGMCEFDQQIVWSTHNLSYPGHDQLHPWQRADRHALYADPTHGPVLEYMAPLHDLFTQLDHDRLTDYRTQPGATGRPRGIA